METKKNKTESAADKKNALKKLTDANINPGTGKKISHSLRQYPRHIGKHGIDDERNLNPEE